MISYKGRLAFIQYMPKKPKKWGMKAWVLSESKTGYVYNWHLYTGREEREEGTSLSMSIVLSLTEKLQQKGYHFYFDNYYTSPQLCQELYMKGSGSCGTVRLNRKGIPDDFQRRKLTTKGECYSYKKEKVTGIKWLDKRVVSLLTTIHDASLVSVERWGKKGKETVLKPSAIVEYNKYMGGVDVSDQLITYYGFPHFSQKWWKRVFYHLLDTTLVNSYNHIQGRWNKKHFVSQIIQS